jgi:hypothetical protein
MSWKYEERTWAEDGGARDGNERIVKQWFQE